MTELATRPAEPGDAPRVEWVEPEQKRRSPRKLWLGIGIPVVSVVAAGALVLVGTTLTAPGVTVLGTDVGVQTTGGAAEALSAGVQDASITVKVEGQSASFTGEDLGLAVDAEQTAEAVKDAYPLWKIGEWNPGAVEGELTVDEAVTSDALEKAFPDLHTAPVNAQVEFQDDSYIAVPDEKGHGIDTEAFIQAVSEQLASAQTVQALASGETILAAGTTPSISVDASITETTAPFVEADAAATAEKLNTAISGVSFTLDGDTVDEAGTKKVASWLDVAVTDDGTVDVQAKTDLIQKYVDALPQQVDQEPVDADVVVDASGNVSKVITEGQDGYSVTGTDGIAQEIEAQLTSLKPAEVALTGEKVTHERTERFRRAVVDKSDGHSYFYETVNDGEEKLMKSFPMALGKPGHETVNGTYPVYGQLTIQDMGSCDAEGEYVPGGRFDYCTADVPFVTYFNGDQGFHGTYWHSNFGPGAYMSHGCVNLTESAAEWVYYFLQTGSPVTVQD